MKIDIDIELGLLPPLISGYLCAEGNRREFPSAEVYAFTLIERALERQMLAYVERELAADMLQTDEQLRAAGIGRGVHGTEANAEWGAMKRRVARFRAVQR
jgi:hypothetical protein